MANEIYANGMELACKAGAGKTICAMPDVCFTPPENPATPPGVPVPYPNTGFASDTTEGSKTVKISGEEIMLKNKSYFKKSTGDEAGCAAKKGELSSTNTGKVYFIKWSMDVKFEGENVDRHLDMTTDNHNSPNANEAVPWPYVDTQTISPEHPCYDSVRNEQRACNPPQGQTPTPHMNSNGEQDGVDCNPACAEARACALPMKKYDKNVCCHPNTTGDHLIEVNCFTQSGLRQGYKEFTLEQLEAIGVTFNDGARTKSRIRPLAGFDDYDDKKAPTACVGLPIRGTNHYEMQKFRDSVKRQILEDYRGEVLWEWFHGEKSYWTYDEAASAGVASHQSEFKDCDPLCTRAQLDAYHHTILPGKTPKEKNAAPVRTDLPEIEVPSKWS